MDIDSLRKEYCPPLDEALFFAVASDFDLKSNSGVSDFRQTLDSLKDGAIEEQELEMLPASDTHEQDLKPSTAFLSNTGAKITQDSSPGSLTSNINDRESSSITTAFSGLGVSDLESVSRGSNLSGYGETGTALEDLPDEEKIEWLMTMFPSVEQKTIKSVLARCKGKIEQSTDELLNWSFLNDIGLKDEQPTIPIIKGIDAFATSDNEGRNTRKGKSKGRRKQHRADHIESDAWYSDSGQTSGVSTPDPNVWVDAPRDIEFIAARTKLTSATIKSAYHANGARLASTIRALAAKEGEAYTNQRDHVENLVKWQLEELQNHFDHIDETLIYGALMMTGRNPSAAMELLGAIDASAEQSVILGKVPGLATYAPLDLSDGEAKAKIRLPTTTWASTGIHDGHNLGYMANAHGVAASQAFNQAASAYKRGKSDRLMGGAAAYYAAVGHDHVQAARAAQRHQADAHVARQSTSTVMDLHGVSVVQAVRIAKEGTEGWWDGLGDRKYVPVGGVGNGFRIVTGIGRHSADGVGKIGPAVSKMLVREGWKVEVGRGEVTVWGRARKK